MGGGRSGRWGRRSDTPLVEESLALDIATFGENGNPSEMQTAGTLLFRDESGDCALEAQYAVKPGAGNGVGQLALRYSRILRGVLTTIRLEIGLTVTKPFYGGCRYWLTCPKCHRRVKRILLPPGLSKFACRECHRLAYRSSRESHSRRGELRRIFRRLGYQV